MSATPIIIGLLIGISTFPIIDSYYSNEGLPNNQKSWWWRIGSDKSTNLTKVICAIVFIPIILLIICAYVQAFKNM